MTPKADALLVCLCGGIVVTTAAPPPQEGFAAYVCPKCHRVWSWSSVEGFRPGPKPTPPAPEEEYAVPLALSNMLDRSFRKAGYAVLSAGRRRDERGEVVFVIRTRRIEP